MNKIVFYLSTFIFSLSFTNALAQDKKIAMLETIAVTDDISNLIKNKTRVELAKSLNLKNGILAFSSTEIDQLMKVDVFQEHGMVDEEHRLKLRKLSEANYACISRISKAGDAYYIEAILIDIETGKIEDPASAFTKANEVSHATNRLATELIKKTIDAIEQKRDINKIGNVKKIVMLESVTNTEDISNLIRFMVRGELSKSLSHDDGFSAFANQEIDQLMKANYFQESGTVEEEQRVQLGKLSGADYVCVSKITKAGGKYYIEASLIDIMTGRIEDPQIASADDIIGINRACHRVSTDMIHKLTYISEQGFKASPPPEVTILSPLNKEFYVDQLKRIEFSLNTTENWTENNIVVEINGAPASKTEYSYSDGKGYFYVSLPAKGSCNLTVKSKTQYGYGKPALITLIKKRLQTKPRLVILAIGINDYENSEIVDLDYAAKDASDFVEIMKASNHDLYKEVKSKSLLNSEATKEAILDGLSWIESSCTQDDVAIIFIAGHGGVDNRDGYYYFPYGANPNSLRSTCVPYTEFNRTLSILLNDLGTKALFLTDACHSGGGIKTRSATVSSVVHDLTSTEDGAFSFASSTGAQKSMEDSKWENGAFTEALLEGISGKADADGDRVITILELINFVTGEVKNLTGNQQTPMHETFNGNNFPLIMVQ
ncbi:caspase family protein [Plebeiibacterium sediminum]|uniref:Caspase family protein n=1 Tax=Plebeiibacterium sediminum TaxID=2992112 RepID=A0AAE3M3H9_9BACT|nr:caspase family protein [Plebeiobacterium sediminum]MCW3786449.1 caspase family protein [Plebeiobacterium sediminum]